MSRQMYHTTTGIALEIYIAFHAQESKKRRFSSPAPAEARLSFYSSLYCRLPEKT